MDSRLQQIAAAENSWRAASLLYCTVLGTAILIGFSIQHLLAHQPIPATLALCGLPFMMVSAMRAREKPFMSFWAPYPAVGFLLALLLLTLLLPDVFGGAALMWFCVIPPATMFALKSRNGLIASAIMFVPMVMTLFFGRHELAQDFAIRLCLAYVFVTALTYKYERNRERAMQDLSDAETRISTLEGMLNMCGWCHQRMKDDDGRWVTTERFLTDRAPITFNHGMCPDCAEKVEIQLDEAS